MWSSTLPVESGDDLLLQPPALLCIRLCSRLYKLIRTLQPSVPSSWGAIAHCLLSHAPRCSMSPGSAWAGAQLPHTGLTAYSASSLAATLVPKRVPTANGPPVFGQRAGFPDPPL